MFYIENVKLKKLKMKIILALMCMATAIDVVNSCNYMDAPDCEKILAAVKGTESVDQVCNGTLQTFATCVQTALDGCPPGIEQPTMKKMNNRLDKVNAMYGCNTNVFGSANVVNSCNYKKAPDCEKKFAAVKDTESVHLVCKTLKTFATCVKTALDGCPPIIKQPTMEEMKKRLDVANIMYGCDSNVSGTAIDVVNSCNYKKAPDCVKVLAALKGTESVDQLDLVCQNMQTFVTCVKTALDGCPPIIKQPTMEEMKKRLYIANVLYGCDVKLSGSGSAIDVVNSCNYKKAPDCQKILAAVKGRKSVDRVCKTLQTFATCVKTALDGCAPVLKQPTMREMKMSLDVANVMYGCDITLPGSAIDSVNSCNYEKEADCLKILTALKDIEDVDQLDLACKTVQSFATCVKTVYDECPPIIKQSAMDEMKERLDIVNVLYGCDITLSGSAMKATALTFIAASLASVLCYY